MLKSKFVSRLKKRAQSARNRVIRSQAVGRLMAQIASQNKFHPRTAVRLGMMNKNTAQLVGVPKSVMIARKIKNRGRSFGNRYRYLKNKIARGESLNREERAFMMWFPKMRANAYLKNLYEPNRLRRQYASTQFVIPGMKMATSTVFGYTPIVRQPGNMSKQKLRGMVRTWRNKSRASSK